MSRPSFQFYHGDWRSNAKLRRCTDAERGIWIDLMCLFADADEFGILRWPLRDLAQASGCKVALLNSLRSKDVLKGSDTEIEAYLFTPRHAGRDGEPVILIPAQSGPLWYSSRMVRDEYIRTKRGEGTRFGDGPNGTPNPTIGDGKIAEPKSTPSQREGDGPPSSTSSSSTSTTESKSKAKSTADAPSALRGARLPPDWVLPKAWGDWALAEQPTWTSDYCRKVAEMFRNYWKAKPGKDATKLDWEATWRNWVFKEGAMRGGGAPRKSLGELLAEDEARTGVSGIGAS